jgi:hypothetical protein
VPELTKGTAKTIPESGASLFLYRDSVSDISESATKGPVIVCGGRGLGKTEVVGRIAALAAAASSDPDAIECVPIPGADRVAARRKIIDAAASEDGPPRLLIIDDLDRALQPAPGDTDTLQLIHSLEQMFRLDPRKTPSRLVATSSISFRGDRAMRLAADISEASSAINIDDMSQILLIPDLHPLNPWSGDWALKLGELFHDEFEERLGKRLTTAWDELIRDLSGGHPALFGPIIHHIQLLLQDLGVNRIDDVHRWLVDPDSNAPAIEDQIRLFVEDLLVYDGMPTIRGAVRRLQQSTDPNEVSAFEMLLTIPKEGSLPENPISRAILVEDGLVHRDLKTGRYVIPGKLIRAQVGRASRWSAPEGRRPEAVVRVDPTASDEGDLLYGDKSVRLRGQPWKVLQKLYDGRGNFFTLVELDGGRNSVQRLRDELERIGCGHLVENVYRRGYRFVSTDPVTI